MKKLLLTFFAFCTFAAQADEGMWLPSLLNQGRIKDMRANGLKLTAEDLYSINKASLKDAIVRFGNGCTGELISDQGLLLTNHHCGYGQIQAHSSLQNDYLTYGFAAMNKEQELPNPGLVVSFLQEMTDVTNEVLRGVAANMSEQQRKDAIKKNTQEIIQRATNGNGLSATVESQYYGNQYFLFTYKVYQDVRLVFAPASAIGKFGGDTDNWMWPRHTGDFSIFRIYADKNNNPAPYSKDNVPFVPKKSFKLSVKGVKEGDFTFVYGFPARTNEYLHSEAVRYIEEIGDPMKIGLRTIRLDIINREQEKSQEVRIKYASKSAGIANAWKKWQGEVLGVKRMKTVETKQKLEAEFVKWAADKPEYKGTVEKLGALYQELEPYAFARDYYAESALSSEIIRFAASFANVDMAQIDKIRGAVEGHFKNYDLTIDKETTSILLDMLKKNVDPKFLPNLFNAVSAEQISDDMFARSIFTSKEKLMEVLSKSAAKRIIEEDPAFELAKAFYGKYQTDINPKVSALNADIESLYNTYMRGLMKMQTDRQFYPDANSTLRITYGKVQGYTPRDGVYYKPFTTLEGVMEKDNPEIYDYDVPTPLRDAYYTKNYGQWAVNGTVPVCFLASNHTTGGNSGSPVLNAHGELIGINFDRTWEGTMSDIQYDLNVCRNISLDVRYILFVIDKIGGAGYLIDEMKIVRK